MDDARVKYAVIGRGWMIRGNLNATDHAPKRGSDTRPFARAYRLENEDAPDRSHPNLGYAPRTYVYQQEWERYCE